MNYWGDKLLVTDLSLHNQNGVIEGEIEKEYESLKGWIRFKDFPFTFPVAERTFELVGEGSGKFQYSKDQWKITGDFYSPVWNYEKWSGTDFEFRGEISPNEIIIEKCETQILGGNLSVSGKVIPFKEINLIGTISNLVFPENAELSLLSPFKKGYFELLNTYESDQIEIEIINYDVRTKGKLSQSRHDKPVIEILSIEDSSLIRKEPYPFVRIQDTGGKVLLRSKVNSYFDQYVEIPGRGQYQLKVFRQPLQTLESYETTTVEFYRVVNGPILLLRATEVENKQIKNLTPVGESYIPYAFKEPPYSLVGVEKRKLRLFK